MNLDHLKAFVWLRYRLRVNSMRRGGLANKILLSILGVLVALAALGGAFGAFLIGCFALGDAPAYVVMLTWDGLTAFFLFAWMAGLMADLQRAEALSIDKVLHLPVSPAGAFLVNYVSSLASLTLAVFVPAALGLTLGLAASRGPLMLLTLPPLAAFVFAVTALTYQFQGWLATLMANPRRRRTVIALFTVGFITLAQAPNLINVIRPWGAAAPDLGASQEAFNADMRRSQEAFDADMAAAAAAAPGVTAEQHRERLAEATRAHRERAEQAQSDHAARLAGAAGVGPDKQARLESAAWLVNTLVPPGWLPRAAGGLAAGAGLPALLSTLAFALVGAASLSRAYRTTLRLYTGHATAAETGVKPVAEAAPAGPPRLRMVEWRLPGVPEPAAAVAAAALRALTRAPEAKMLALSPVILVVVFGSMAAGLPFAPPEALRPLIAAAGAGIVLLSASQLVGNQFGYDRSGFRAYVLGPVPRRDVLLGKNLAAAPLVLGLALFAVLFVGVAFPMRFDHLLAAVAQAASMFLVFCLLANLLSILAPLPIAAGAMQPGGVKFSQVLGQFAFVIALPTAVGPTFLPLGAEALLEEAGYGGLPVALALSLLVLAGVAALYWVALGWQGALLARREQEVLRVVTSKEE